MKKTNKDGQAIGRKGAESRARLLAATRQLLIELPSARKLTASSIARAAGLASQTFYLYFDDVEEVLFCLSEEASADTTEIIEALDSSWDPAAPNAYTQPVVAAFYRYWDRHRPILNIRNYMADRGDEAFATLRNESAIPIILRIAQRIRTGQGEARLSERDSTARAIIIFSAIERMAGRYANNPGLHLMPSSEEMKRAEADILALLMSPAPVVAL
ncbi:MAG TPA: TetR/AcrR family transcriptional regulator [Acidocella sp.]|jgi:AcrR family transcriptional regulator|nr:TetR/AcrR family transcriptional regulator [Acidocella sp.]